VRFVDIDLTVLPDGWQGRADQALIDLCIKNAIVNAKRGEARIGGCIPAVSLATFESGRWIG